MMIDVASGQDVVVLGYEGEPMLQMRADGSAAANVRSPSYWLNQELAGAPVRDDADADADPVWEQIPSERGILNWHDHRLHYMGSAAPTAADGEVVQTFVVDLVADGRPVAVTGAVKRHADVPFDRYRVRLAGTATDEGGSSSIWLFLGGGAVLVAALSLAGPALARRRRGVGSVGSATPAP